MKKETSPSPASLQEVYLLETLPLLCRIAAARSRNIPDWTTIEDLRQTVALNLLKWKSRRPDLVLSAEEWSRLANRAMSNQIKTFHQTRKLRSEVDLTEIEEKKQSPLSVPAKLQNRSPEGNTEAEAGSLLQRVWYIIKALSMREKYAVLFKSEDLLASLIGRRGCGLKEAAEVCGLELGELFALIELLPLADEEIARLLESRLGHPVTGKQVLEARHRAKTKIKTALDKKDTRNAGKRFIKKE